jgi:hypothetical protein
MERKARENAGNDMANRFRKKGGKRAASDAFRKTENGAM